MQKTALILYTMLSVSNPSTVVDDVSLPESSQSEVQEVASSLLSSKSFSLKNRYKDGYVNDIFKDNILLTLNYMSGLIMNKKDINWDDIGKPRTYLFSLQPGERFAFHDQVLPEYKSGVVKTTNAHFNYQDGFKSDGYLTGDGVCHLASLLYWASKDAGLEAIAPTNHNFALINEIPKEYGVSIYNLPGSFNTSSVQNLYIKNNLDKTVTFTFNFNGEDLRIKIDKSNS